MRMHWLLLAAVICTTGKAGSDVGPRIDSIFAPLTDAKSPGFAVLVRKNSRTVFERGYGIRDLRAVAKIGATTDFRLASFTKQFTAMAVMLLVHDGKLRYNTTLTDIFPDFPAYGQHITIRHLLTHTSGLPDYEDLMDSSWSPAHQISDQEVLQLLKRQQAAKFAPGTSWSYSNSGYVVLGLSVARISGEPFGKFLHERIFAPLGMSRTLAYVKGANEVPERALGHRREGDKFIEADQSSTSATLGDGGVYSNIEDLAKWDAALERHTLLSAREMEPALTPVRLADGSQPRWPQAPGEDNLAPGKPVWYGFGWFLDPYEGRKRMWHTGTTMGFRTAIERFTTENLTVVLLANRTDIDAAKLALRTAEMFFSQK